MVATLAAPVAQAETWTLSAAHEHVLKEGRLDALTEAEQTRARAEARAALPRENPFLGAQREQDFGVSAQGLSNTGGADSYVWLGQTLDFSFRRGLLDDAGARRANAEGFAGEARKVEQLLAFDALFYGVVADTQRLRAYDAWLARLEELGARTEAREKKGDASRYEVLRVEREKLKAEQARTTIELNREAALGELRAWLHDPAAEIAGDVELAPPPLDAPGATPRPLRALAWDERSRALALEEEAASRWYLPPVTATLGGKTTEAYLGDFAPSAVGAGYYLTVQVPLPVFERGDDKREALASERRAAELSAEVEAHHVMHRAESARALANKALSVLAAQRNEGGRRGEALVTTARAAWAGGELPLLALLEAERALLDDDLITIDLGITARQADLVHRALQSQLHSEGDHETR